MEINIIYGDLFSIVCDAYLNPPDIHLSGSGGLDGEIHRRGGIPLIKECAAIKYKMMSGCAEFTTGGELPVKYVLHMVCLKCTEEQGDSYSLLADCYRNMLVGFYKDLSFRMLPDSANRCIEVLADVGQNPWIGTIRRRYDQWGNPVEFEGENAYFPRLDTLLEILIFSSDYFRDFFQK